jgi:predicted nucleotidyltransferase
MFLHQLEYNVGKFLRPFQRPLEAEETDVRCNATLDVVTQLASQGNWASLISGAIIFGSTAWDEARTGSDVDLAVLSRQPFFFEVEYAYDTQQLREAVWQQQQALGYGDFKINPLIVAETWLIGPNNAAMLKPEVLGDIAEGIKIF